MQLCCFVFPRGVQRNDYAHFFFKWISVHWYQTFQRKVCLFTSFWGQVVKSLQGSATTLGSIDGFLRPPPPFTVSHPSSLFYANEVGREALCELQLQLQLCVRLRSWCRKVLCCVPVPLGFAALYIHSVWMKRERERQSLNAVGVGGVFRSEPQAALYDTGFPKPRLELWKKVNRFINSLFIGVIYTIWLSCGNLSIVFDHRKGRE